MVIAFLHVSKASDIKCSLKKKNKAKQETKFRLRKKYEIETKMNWQKQQLNNTALEEVKQRDILMALDRNDVILLSFKIKLSRRKNIILFVVVSSSVTGNFLIICTNSRAEMKNWGAVKKQLA